jgi:hypothetical protein
MKISNPLRMLQKVLTEKQRYKKIAPFFSVANSKEEFWALLITKGGVRGDVGSEKPSYGGKLLFQIFSSPYIKWI